MSLESVLNHVHPLQKGVVVFLGSEPAEEEIRQFDTAEERHRIGRDLHDGFIQALAGINLRLESCRRLLHDKSVAEALTDLTQLQESVNREYDELRAYMRSLAGLEMVPRMGRGSAETTLSVSAEFSGSVELVDHVLQILREGVANIRHHARANAGRIQISTSRSEIHIGIEDDGVGFRTSTSPWSIASRVTEMGGRLQVDQDHGQGARLSIRLPQC